MGAQSVATSVRFVFKPPLDPGAPEPDRRDSLCAANARHVGETYVVADPEPLTLAEIIAALRAGEGRPPRCCRSRRADRRCAQGRGQSRYLGSAGRRAAGQCLQVLSRTGWTPSVRTAEGLAAMAARIAVSAADPCATNWLR